MSLKCLNTTPFHTKSIFKFFFGAIENERCCRMKINDCYGCRYNHWGLGIGVGVACVHPDNQKYNSKQRKQGEERIFHNSTTQVIKIPVGATSRKRLKWKNTYMMN